MSSMHAIAPDDIVATFAEAEGNARGPLVVTEPLKAFLDEHGLGAGELEIEPVGEGHSNVTYGIRRGDQRFVLRRPPRPPRPRRPPPALPAPPPARPAVAAQRARRPARGARAARDRRAGAGARGA